MAQRAVVHEARQLGRGKRGGNTRRERGFSLIEVQIAIIVLAITIFTLGGHHKIMNDLLRGAQQDRRVAGYFDLTAERAFLVISDNGKNAGPPPCDVMVTDVQYTGSDPRVYVRVQEAPW